MTHRSLVILTGAGISAESGLATFRDAGGLWEGHRIEDVATPEAFARNPALVHHFYNLRRAQLAEAAPNAAHHAIARLAAAWQGPFLLVTQNVDNLHDRALAAVSPAPGFHFLHMHGQLDRARCLATGQVHPWSAPMDTTTPCPCCGQAGNLRPHIVWFGEMPLDMEVIDTHLHTCDLFISVGTSGNVYPAAGFVQQVRRLGHGHTVEINLEPSQGHSLFHTRRYGPATKKLPEFIDELLIGQRDS